MKKHIKGFTLIECLIALAVLGIAALTMAQIYAGVARRNRNNQITNTSLSNQMAYVERYTQSESVAIYYGSTTNTPDAEAAQGSTTKKPPHKNTKATNYNYVQIKKVKPIPAGASDPSEYDPLSDNYKTANRESDNTYSFPVDVHVLLSRDSNDVNSSGKDLNGASKSFSGQYKDLLENPDPTKSYEDDYNLRYRYLLGHTN